MQIWTAGCELNVENWQRKLSSTIKKKKKKEEDATSLNPLLDKRHFERSLSPKRLEALNFDVWLNWSCLLRLIYYPFRPQRQSLKVKVYSIDLSKKEERFAKKNIQTIRISYSLLEWFGERVTRSILLFASVRQAKSSWYRFVVFLEQNQTHIKRCDV